MCEKLSFDSFEQGQKIVNKALSWGRTDRRRQNTKKPKRVYKCPECGKYHLTSKKKENKTKHYH